MKVVVNKTRCVGAGDCVNIAPKVFALDDNNMAIVLDTTAADDDTLFTAAEECPSQAIYLYDDNGQELYPNM